MVQEILLKILNIIIPAILGYCLNIIKNYKKRNNSINNALMVMLQTNLSNAYFVHNEKKQISDYLYKNWLTMLKEYENLGGNDYVHELAEKIKSWEIVRTDVISDLKRK